MGAEQQPEVRNQTVTSNRDPDARYESLPQGMTFFGEQLLKRVHTSLPGIVNTYDASTRRARVQPAIDLLLTNGTSMPKPIILDVPVLFPSGGGYTIHVPLAAGDPVMIFFSERDIARFKATLTSGAPLSDDIMEAQHAVAVPGFVAPTTALVGDGLVLQTTDGSTFIQIEGNNVTITANNVRLIGLTSLTGNMVVSGTVDGVDVSAHTHAAGSLNAPMGGGTVTGDTGGPS